MSEVLDENQVEAPRTRREIQAVTAALDAELDVDATLPLGRRGQVVTLKQLRRKVYHLKQLLGHLPSCLSGGVMLFVWPKTLLVKSKPRKNFASQVLAPVRASTKS